VNEVVLRGRVHRAQTYGDRLVGLMFAFHWPPDYDVLVFDRCRSVHTCFTFVRPDLIFLDPEHRVLKGVVKAPPWRIHIGPSRTASVLEVQSGIAPRGLKTGDLLSLEEIANR